jgi:hypothetical protein
MFSLNRCGQRQHLQNLADTTGTWALRLVEKTVSGRAIALTEAVTLDDNVVSVPTCGGISGDSSCF